MPKKTTFLVVACIILMCLCDSSIAQTKSIRGVVNSYSRVTGINAVTRSVTLNDASIFKQVELPDTVLLIQMTGIDSVGNVINNAGRYEFHIVTRVSDSTVTLQSTPGKYDTNELVQMIRVPSYVNANIDGTLTCKEWVWADGTGGVLALMVEGTLTFNADIDVSGLGFKGGKACETVYTGPCSKITEDGRNYPDASNLAGYKGEGAVTIDFFNPNDPKSKLKGYMPAWNGGGGGNGKWSGGGGGGNGNSGGMGGDQACSAHGFMDSDAYALYGNGGNSIKYGVITTSEHVFMGGGGGAGTGIGTAGSSGGGIVIIVAEKLQFNSNTTIGTPYAIKANGGLVENKVIDEGGAGGGGAGGTILLSVKDYGNIHAEIMGANGGNVNRRSCSDNDHSMGAGGGGSGGFMQISDDREKYKNWIDNQLLLTGGEAGSISISGAPCEIATGRQSGVFFGNFEVQLRGFLYNYLISPSDSVCYGEQVTIRASQPVGVTEDYSNYEWEFLSDDEWTKIEKTDETTLTVLKYTFTKDTDIRRTVISGIKDVSSRIKIKVRKPVSNNIIAPSDTTLCWREGELKIRGSMPTGGGGGPYDYEWEKLDDKGISWKPVGKAVDQDLFIELPESGGIQQYRRKVQSKHGCSSTSDTAVITVFPAIINKITPPKNSEVCGDTAKLLTGILTGGNGDYDRQWEYNTDKNNEKGWKNISKETDYQPDLRDLNDYGEYFFRRIVESGKESGVCIDTSNVVKIRFDRQPLPSDFYTITNGETGDLVDDKALKFQFTVDIEVIKPSYEGIWTWAWASIKENEREHPVYTIVGEPKITVINLEYERNTILWKVTNGVCLPDSFTVVIEVKDIIVYNGLSPNNDKKNDCFVIDGGENATSSELIIFDRYNNIVFKSSMSGNEIRNCTCWWDGRSSSGKELPSGTYYYHLILNKEKEKKGYVVLKRQ